MGNNFLILITIIFLVLYFPRLIGWFGWIFPQKRLTCESRHRFALIVPARDEGRAVLPLFKSIETQSYSAEYWNNGIGNVDKHTCKNTDKKTDKKSVGSLFDTYVIVKNPHDEVIGYAREIGAKVYVDEEQKSKGDCLDYCIRHILAVGKKYDGYIIVDADCRLDVDFIKNMNDALASGAQVITARKLVGNYTMDTMKNAATCNRITCQNGLIWPIIDELGNRFKSAVGLTTMPITTGILIRGDLVEEWGGWIYRQTLTEDMELLRDCACKGIKTFHYSFAKLYLEETPSHADTNKRRTRWMTGMVSADRLYYRELLNRRGVWAFIDNYYILSLWLVYAYIGTLSVAGVFNLVTLRIWQAAAAFLLIYTAFFALSVMAVLADWKNIRLSWIRKLCLMLAHPFFYMEYIFIVGRAVLGVKPKSWEKIGRVQY